MDKVAVAILNKTNKQVIKYLELLDNYKCYELEIDTHKFKSIDFSLPEKVLLLEYNQLLKPIEKNIKNTPCVYTLEIIKGDTKQIIKAYKKLKKNNKSALKKEIDYKTNFLYVGRSKATIKHRLRVHLGYRNTSENALQLLHWAKPLGLELKLNIYTFPKELEFLLPLYEARFQEKLNPLIGFR